MNYIIDEHNLISMIPGLSLSMPDDEQRLIELLIRFGKQGKKRMEVYFDRAPVGLAGDQNYGRVRAHFVHHNLTADQAIRSKLHSLQKSSKNWLVVTSDRSVQAAAHEAHAGVMSSEEFADQLQASMQASTGGAEPTDKPLNETEVGEWLEIFKGHRKQS
jgi:predicted RNA-binding protein with PIN domain